MSSMKFQVEHAKSGRSRCKKCKVVISKDEIRVGKVVEISGNESTQWFHPTCMTTRSPIEFENVNGLDTLKESDREQVEEALHNTSKKKAVKATPKKTAKAEPKKSPKKRARDEETDEANESRRNSKRKAKKAVKYEESDVEDDVGEDDETVRDVESEADSDFGDDAMSDDDVIEIDDDSEEVAKPKAKKSKKVVVKPTGRNKRKTEMTMVKKQPDKPNESDEITAKYSKMTISELKEHLKRNKQLLGGKKEELVARCVDGEKNGALEHCTICGEGRLHLDTSGSVPLFICKGYFDEELNARVPCSFSGDESQISRRKWLQPGEEDDNDAASSSGNTGSGSASSVLTDKVLADVEASCPSSMSLKSAVAELVKLAKKYKLTVSSDESTVAQQCIGFLLGTKSGSGVDAKEAWKQLVAAYPTKVDSEKAKPKRVARVEANTELAAVFDELALLESKIQADHANFKIASNKKAANAIRMLNFKVTSGKDLAKGNKKKGIEKVKGLGEASSKVIDEFLETGKCSRIEEMREKVSNM